MHIALARCEFLPRIEILCKMARITSSVPYRLSFFVQKYLKSIEFQFLFGMKNIQYSVDDLRKCFDMIAQT